MHLYKDKDIIRTISGKGDIAIVLIIGLTGGIASGKSTVSQYLKSLGAVIIDADVLARELVKPQKEAWEEIITTFGRDIVDEQGLLKRKKLGSLVFNSAQAREELNSILHPKIIQGTKEMIRGYKKKNIPVVIVDAPLLIEAGMTALVDEVWLVAVPEEIQIERVMQRDEISREAAEGRLKSQMPLKDKLKYADRVIDNSGEVAETKKNVDELWDKICKCH